MRWRRVLWRGSAQLMLRSLGCGAAVGMTAWKIAAGAPAPDLSWQEIKLATIATLRIPRGMELWKNLVRYPDFRIYRVFNLGAELLGIYLGNAPNFPNRSAAAAVAIGSCPELD